jgi:hypothetical protein
MRWWPGPVLTIVGVLTLVGLTSSRRRSAMQRPNGTSESVPGLEPGNEPGAAGSTGTGADLREIPLEAGCVGKKYADYLELGELEEPLAEFLAEAGQVEGLDGIGVTLWEAPRMPPMLAIYAFSDLGVVDQPGAPSPDTATAKVYSRLRTRVNGFAGARLRLTFWSLNSAGGTWEDVVATFPTQLKDLASGDHDLGDVVLRPDLAVLRRGALRRAA